MKYNNSQPKNYSLYRYGKQDFVVVLAHAINKRRRRFKVTNKPFNLSTWQLTGKHVFHHPSGLVGCLLYEPVYINTVFHGHGFHQELGLCSHFLAYQSFNCAKLGTFYQIYIMTCSSYESSCCKSKPLQSYRHQAHVAKQVFY